MSDDAHSHSYSHSTIKTLLSWSAPGRPYTKRGRDYYGTIILIALFLSIISFLFGEVMLILVIVAVSFLAIALSSAPPKNFHYKINTEGIKFEDHFYIWDELYDFYFRKMEGVDVLIVRTKAFLPGELRIPLGNVSKEHARNVLIHFLPFREVVSPTFMEKSGDWLARNFPLER